MSGYVHELDDHNEIKLAVDLKKLNIVDDSRKPEYYCHPNPRRMYRFRWDKLWVNIRILNKGQWIDTRLYINGL